MGNWRIQMAHLAGEIVESAEFSRAYEVGEQHYDLGNDLYQAMLDKRLNYTCAYWKDAKNLDEAQEAKLDLVCRKIEPPTGNDRAGTGLWLGQFCKICCRKIRCKCAGGNGFERAGCPGHGACAKVCRWSCGCRITAKFRANLIASFPSV